MYWYCERLCTVPTWMDWIGEKKAWMPGTSAVDRRSLAMTSMAVAVRAGLSRSVMNRKPAFWVELPPPPPMFAMTETTSGSCLTISASRRERSTMASKETSSGPSVAARIRPLSSLGKKPFGMSRNRTKVRAKVPSVMPSMMTGMPTTLRTDQP